MCAAVDGTASKFDHNTGTGSVTATAEVVAAMTPENRVPACEMENKLLPRQNNVLCT